ncbi:MAG: group 1 truncated hemoglobin [Granulosicoccus sp.]|nr:group 1 truncated hemoglobin [Granulosicoccus sp.]
MAVNLYEKYGGFSNINKIVMAFYDHLLDSETVGPYFDDIDMARLIDHQTKFIAMLLGGPASFTNEQLGRAHVSLGVTAEHFDEMKFILQHTLDEHGVEPDDTQSVLDAVEARRGYIVTDEAS